MSRLKSLRSRLLWAALVWVILVTIAGSWALSYAFRTTAQDSFDARLSSLLSVMIGLVDVNLDGTLNLERSIGDPQFEKIYSGWYWLVSDATGAELRSRSLWDLDFTLQAPPVSALPSVWNATDPLGREVRVASQSVLLPGSGTPVSFAVTGDLDVVRADVRRFDWILRAALASLGIALVIAILAQVAFGLRPLNRLTKDIEAVRAGRASTVARSGTMEIDALIDELNSLIQHNRGLVERARASASDLAHALKTPLAVMQSVSRGESDAATEQREQIAVMERMITRHLARAATAGPGNYSPAPLAPMIAELTRGLDRIYLERRLEVVKEIPQDLAYRADQEDLEEMIGNLLENAYKWARSQVRIVARLESTMLILAIEDDGTGVGPEQLKQATERGVRFDEKKPGSGLGLSIVTDVAAIYGGTLALSQSTLGGLRAQLALPTEPRAAVR